MLIEFEDVRKKKNIIDIRTSIEFNEYNIDGSINISRLKLLGNPDNYMNKEEEFYLICNKGEVSLSCSKILNALGYRCYSIIGGIDGLKKKL